VFLSEFALVRQAFYTEPADQSGWLYHRWLLSRVAQSIPTLPALLISLGHSDMLGGSSDSTGNEAAEGSESAESDGCLDPLAVFGRELDMCRELDAIEPNCKWILLTTALLLAGRDAISRRHTEQHGEAVSGAMAESVAAELSSLCGRLEMLDPLRTNYYRDVHASFTSRREESHAATAVG